MMKVRSIEIYVFAAFWLLATACQQNASTTPKVALDLKEFEEEPLKGTSVKRVIRRNVEGNVIEEGFVRAGLKDGAWITYDNEGKVISVTTYIEGQLNGIHLELDKSYRLVSTTGYKNNDFLGQPRNINLVESQRNCLMKMANWMDYTKNFMKIMVNHK
ncbi:MAG: hypothetical protein HC912_06500 [Saprospiraceae bacterium]|nr:hypothetical protein [Saprospiraceae bacterium]